MTLLLWEKRAQTISAAGSSLFKVLFDLWKRDYEWYRRKALVLDSYKQMGPQTLPIYAKHQSLIRGVMETFILRQRTPRAIEAQLRCSTRYDLSRNNSGNSEEPSIDSVSRGISSTERNDRFAFSWEKAQEIYLRALRQHNNKENIAAVRSRNQRTVHSYPKNQAYERPIKRLLIPLSWGLVFLLFQSFVQSSIGFTGTKYQLYFGQDLFYSVDNLSFNDSVGGSLPISLTRNNQRIIYQTLILGLN